MKKRIFLACVLCSCFILGGCQSTKVNKIPAVNAEYLGLSCIALQSDKEDVLGIYQAMYEEGIKQHYTPCIIFLDDLNVLNDMNAMTKEEYGSIEAFTQQCLKTYPEVDLEAFFEERKQVYGEQLQNRGGGIESIEDIVEPQLTLYSTSEKVYIAKVPTDKPYEVFAYIPMGGWNDCPDNTTHIAVAKKWYETYGALPCAISYDTIQYYVPQPIKDKDSDLADQMFLYCPDSIYQGVGSLANLETSNQNASIWFLWWD